MLVLTHTTQKHHTSASSSDNAISKSRCIPKTPDGGKKKKERNELGFLGRRTNRLTSQARTREGIDIIVGLRIYRSESD